MRRSWNAEGDHWICVTAVDVLSLELNWARGTTRLPKLRRGSRMGTSEDNMIYSKHSSRSAEDVGKRLGEAAARHKFGVLHVLDMQQTLESKGVELGAACSVYDICNPQAAAGALKADMRVSTLLPCRISVFSEAGGCRISTVKPTVLFKATGLEGAEVLAEEVERELLAMIDEAV